MTAALAGEGQEAFLAHRGVGCHLNVIKLAPNMSPTRGLMNPAAFIKVMKSSVAVCLQCAAEVAQMLARMLALAIGRVSEPDCSRHIGSGRSVIAHIGP